MPKPHLLCAIPRPHLRANRANSLRQNPLFNKRVLATIALAVSTVACLANPITTSATTTASTTQSTANQGKPSESFFNEAVALKKSQSVLGKAPQNYTFLDRQERPVRLSNYRGKPLLVNFIYTGCFQVCPADTRSLSDALENIKKVVGQDQFNVISIGFNQPFDSPQALRIFAEKNGVNALNWEFLSPHESIVNALTNDFGFSYVQNQSGIDHLLQVTLVDAEGRIYSQIYGGQLEPNSLSDPILQLLRGKPVSQSLSISDVIDRVRILCTVYDPTTGKYRYDYGLLLEIAGGCTFLLAMLWLFIDEWFKRRRIRKIQSGNLLFPMNTR